MKGPKLVEQRPTNPNIGVIGFRDSVLSSELDGPFKGFYRVFYKEYSRGYEGG